MRYLTLGEVLALHQRLLAQTGGGEGLRDLGALESAVAQPRMTFGGRELYLDIETKAAALAFSLIKNHPFVDGNKRVGHAAMEIFLLLNGHELASAVSDAESVILGVAAGTLDREGFTNWVRRAIQPLPA